jgi:uracil-DNA glycosylase
MAPEEDDGVLATQLRVTEADVVVTLGQPAADVLTNLLDSNRVVHRRDESYGQERHLPFGRRALSWLPLKHPGQRSPRGEKHHRS